MYKIKKNKNCIVIGAGFAGLSAAASLAQKGFEVTMLEKNSQTGGRARVLKSDGFVFDMGPSWYWMPDVIEQFFNKFGKSTADYFNLIRLDPSYQVIFGSDDVMKVPGDFDELKNEFEKIEKGSAAKLEKFLAEAKYKYDTGMRDFVYKPCISPMEFANWKFIASLFKLDMFRSFSSHARRYFKNPRLLKLLEFPILFLGAMPSKTPALYSMMNYADMKLGTWYPMGGMYKLVEAMTQLAKEQGVEILLNQPVTRIDVNQRNAERIITEQSEFYPDAVIAGADYHHVEQDLLLESDRNYSKEYWNRKTLAPSSLIYYLGVNKKLKKMLHHNLFFDEDFESHSRSIYETKDWPHKPLFYVCAPSVTDDSVAPAGMENLFILIPVAAGLNDNPEIRLHYFTTIIKRLEAFCGENISNHIVFRKSYAGSDFISDYNSFKGNAYGLANTLFQTAIFKPSIKNRKVDNLFFTGQMTVPGPGVPPSIISGQIVANYVTQIIRN